MPRRSIRSRVTLPVAQGVLSAKKLRCSATELARPKTMSVFRCREVEVEVEIDDELNDWEW
jgi:hypothetical protein